MPAAELFQRALSALRTGQHNQAERLFKELLAAEPRHVAGLNLLAVLLMQAERFAEAEIYIRRAIGENASSDVSFYNYGIILKALKRPHDALEQFSHALKINPGVADTWNNRGTTFKELGQHREAIADFDKALSLNANYADAYCNKAGALADLKEFANALAVYDQALSLKPDLAEAWFGRGAAYAELKQTGNALAAYDRALSIKPNLIGAWLGRGYLHTVLKQYDAALADYKNALQFKPELGEAWAGRGAVYAELKQFENALAAYDRALTLKPDLPYATGFRVHCKMQLCDWTEVETDFENISAQMKARKPLSPFVCLSLPSSPAEQLSCAKAFAADRPPFEPLWRGEIYSHDRIRVAYLSADFTDHPVALMSVGLFELHDRARFDVTAISYGPERGSAFRKRIKAGAAHFIDAGDASDEDVAKIIHGREIDIAVDLMGFTENNRFGVLARRPAPIQVNYLGYPATMGSACVDYIFADPTIIPESERPFYAERVVWLPGSYQVNDPKRQAAESTPSRRHCGLPDHGFVFCAFNNTYKLNPAMFDVWMRVLKGVDGSVLWLRQANAAIARNLHREAERRGVDADRLVFAPYESDYTAHLARYRQADVFLDTLPYNAHTTASDALWAGVPVLTCLGETFAGRVAASVLKSAGLPELIARSPEEYEALALRLAREPAYLAALKARLAGNRETLPLFDAAAATRDIEAAYTAMWQRYRRGEAPKAVSDSTPIT